ncbi:hypothetical protein BW727_101256 [Jeotgalibaca dankookensis]|uniref:DUF421 domain-containing protein n=1 Tax=Jeotgalibaca dankookensis TaxID=708126 RepID=A0A1S6IPZ0_9LACT|nr:YetF domain-containing protein [Jeotgalibaca dankookensis]AQS53623.1 hypothetical protein BW727_101256 [Jeotgalibaca dankookensis]
MFALIALKLLFGFLGLLLVVRLLGKKSMSEITPFDLIYTLVLGGILEESIYDDAVNTGHLLFAIGLWAIMIYLIEQFVQKNDKVNKWVKGEPAVLIRNSKLNVKEITKNHIEMEQLRAMLRQEQCFSLENAKHVILETAGQISVIAKSEEDKTMTLLLVDEGKIKNKVLQTNNLDDSWLRKKLQEEGYTNLKEIIYAEWSQEKGFYVITYADTESVSYKIDG